MTESNLTRERIIVGVDGSAESVAALRHAGRLTTALGARLEAICVWHLPMTYDGFYPDDGWSPVEDARRALDAAVAEALGDPASPPCRKTVLKGVPAEVLIEESENASMLVVGCRGRGGFAGLLLGSVSHACASHARCPVLIVQAKPR